MVKRKTSTLPTATQLLCASQGSMGDLPAPIPPSATSTCTMRCGRLDNSLMAGCDWCQGWVHYRCLQMRAAEIHDLPRPWACPACIRFQPPHSVNSLPARLHASHSPVLILSTNSPVPLHTNSPVPLHTNSPVHLHTNSPVPLHTNSPLPLLHSNSSASLHHTNPPVHLRHTNSPVPLHTNSPVPLHHINSPVPLHTNSPVPLHTNSPVHLHTNSPVPLHTNSPLPLLHSNPSASLHHTNSPVHLRHTNSPVPLHTNSPVPLHHINSPVPLHTNSPLPLLHSNSSASLHHTNSPVHLCHTNSPVPLHTNSPVPLHHTNSPVHLRHTNSPVPLHTNSPLPLHTNSPVPLNHSNSPAPLHHTNPPSPLPPRSRLGRTINLPMRFRNLDADHPSPRQSQPPPTPSQPMASQNVPEESTLQLQNILSRRIRTLNRLPRGSRTLAAQSLTNVMKDVIETNSTDAWVKLLIFGKVCFQTPQKSKAAKDKTLTAKLNEALRVFSNGALELNQLGLGPNNARAKNKAKARDINHKLACSVAEKIEQGDIKGAVRLASSSCTIAPINDATVDALKEKHPCSNLDPTSIVLPNPTTVTARVSEKDVQSAISHFPPGSAAGPDGLKPQVLKDMINAPAAESAAKLLASITTLINKVLAGAVPHIIQPFFFGASLTALSKKDGGLRPIAVGNALRRLVGKSTIQSLRKGAAEAFGPHQLGFGIPNGVEAAIHSTTIFLSNPDTSATDNLLIKIDFRNAFNQVHRGHMLERVSSLHPELYSFIYSCYAKPSKLFFGQDYTIDSAEGIQQGDPLGPFLFCLSIQHIVKQLKSPLNAWYLDDGTIGGPKEVVLKDLETIVDLGKMIGLDTNRSKCEVAYLNKEAIAITQLHDFQTTPTNELCLLGAPLGEDSRFDILSAKISELETMGSRLKYMAAHHALFLLRHCFAIPKMTYTLRTSPCFNEPKILEWDTLLKSTLTDLLNVQLTDRQWDKATLPIHLGGLGIRRANDIALPAFLSSVSCSRELVNKLLPQQFHDADIPAFSDYIRTWKETTGLPQTPTSTKQRDWDLPVASSTFSILLGSATDGREKARLLACREKEAGAWLQALPSAPLGLFLCDDHLRVSVGLRLGTSICERHICGCGAQVDQEGVHGLSCQRAAGRFSRHSAINDIIHRALTSAQVPSILEPPGLAREDGKRPDGLTQIPWSNGKCLVWDATCPDTLAPSHLQSTSSQAGGAANGAERLKIRKYTALDTRYLIQPCGIETFGVIGTCGKTFLTEIAKKIKKLSGESKAEAYLLQRIGMAVQRGNAISVLGTLPQGKHLEEIFNLP